MRLPEPPEATTLATGDGVEVMLQLRDHRPAANPGIYPSAGWRAMGHDLRSRLKSYRQLRHWPPYEALERASPGALVAAIATHPRRLAAAVRQRVRLTISKLFPRSSGLANALLLGERGDLDSDFRAAMARAGVSHLLAISGLHLSLLLAIAYSVARACGVSPPAAALLALLVLGAAVLIVVPRASVHRAALMAAILLGGLLIGRRHLVLDSLAFGAAALIFFEPHTVQNRGYQLSVAATAGILLIAPRLGQFLQRWRMPASHSLSASIAAQLGALPLMALSSHRVVLIGMVLNLVAIPWMALLLSLMLAAVVTHSLGVPGLATLLAEAVEQMTKALYTLVRFADGWSWLNLPIRQPRPLIVLAVYGALVGIACAWRRRTRLLACLILWIAIGLLIYARQSARQLQLVALDVGQGEALVLRTPDGQAYLIDAGGFAGSDYDIGTALVAPALRALGVRRLAAVIVTHPHQDHVGGVAGVIRELQVGSLWLGSVPASSPATAAAMAAAEEHRVPVISLAAGHRQRSAGCGWEAWHPSDRWLTAGGTPVSNDAALVLLLRCQRWSILFTGDAGVAAEARWAMRIAPAKTLLKVGHHGSATSSSEQLLDWLMPRRAVISVGWQNRFGLPKTEVLRRYRRRGIAVYRTDRDGAITVTFGNRIKVRGERWSAGRHPAGRRSPLVPVTG